MCHAFFAVGDTGERISHAVGCAFGICLENKQKREKDSVKVNYNERDSSFTRMGTFRGLTDRLTDPQALRPSESPKLSLCSNLDSSEAAFALERPRPSEVMYQRQASFRGLGQLSGNTPFKRASKGHTSLRLNDLPSNKDRVGVCLSDSPILEDLELPPSNLEPDTASLVTQSSKTLDLLTSDDVGPHCYSSELAAMLTGSSTPAMLGVDSSSNYSLSPPPSLPSLLHPVKLGGPGGEREKSENPWDNVPDQPGLATTSSHNTGDQWLNSLTSLTNPDTNNINNINNINNNTNIINNTNITQHTSNIFDYNFDSKFVSEDSKLSVEVQPSSKSTGTSSGYNSPTSTNSSSTQSSSQETWQLAEVSKSILEDPFDAEWAAIATRNTNSESEKTTSPSPAPAQTNPFLTSDSTTVTTLKAFELQL